MNTDFHKPLLKKGIILNGKWEILEHVATGGKGEIYRARQINLEREVAVKIISEQFFAAFGGDEEEIRVERERFRREVLAMAQLRHPCVLQVFDHDRTVIQKNGKELQVDYLVMEYIPGPTLRFTMPEEGFRDEEKALKNWIRKYYLPFLEGVEAIHAIGIVHRDLKPENVLMDGFTPKITDFGLVGGPRWKVLTRSHHVFGTVAYMPPEQFLDMGNTDFRGDIYSLGKMLYEAVTGKMTKETGFPFKSAHLPDSTAHFFKRLDRIIRQATAEDRNQRVPSVKVLRDTIIEILEESPKDLSGKPFRSVMNLAAGITKSMGRRAVVTTILFITVGIFGFVLLSRYGILPVPLDILKTTQQTGQDRKQEIISGSTPAPVIYGKDGVALRFIHGGEAAFSRAESQTEIMVNIDSFYMDATEVTNHQYVEFLNQVLKRLRVEKGVVYGNGRIWLLLGEVENNYEPIVFRDGKFSIKDSGIASHPVVRVTGYGAEMYALYQGRRLPTEKEWIYAFRMGENPSEDIPDRSLEPTSNDMHPQMHTPSDAAPNSRRTPVTVSLLDPNQFGIRGLNGNVGEWTRRSLQDLSERLESLNT